MAGSKRSAAALVAAACVIATPIVQRWEGTVLKTYPDPIGILTSCTGHTGPELKLGQRFTPEQCGATLTQDLQRHAEEVYRCTPTIFEKPKVAAAATSLAYNVGGSAYCKSTAARQFNAGNYRAGCAALGRFIYANGKILTGLVKRRSAEVNLCLEGL